MVSENSRRLAKNTMMLYVRMLFSLIVSLYTTRVVLKTLGATDYGIYNLVGGVVGMMGMFTSLLSQGTSRFITIALGRNSLVGLKNIFSSSLTIHFLLSIIIMVIGELFGPITINKLNIPMERMNSAQIVFQFSLISSVLAIVQSPFNAAIIAHEKMHIFAYISIWDVLAKLLIVFLLLLLDVDKLILYAGLYFVIVLITFLIYIIYCKTHFDECKSLSFQLDKKLYKSIFQYTGWNTIGAFAFTLNTQGVTILLSILGTTVNAARGIASSVSRLVYNFVDSFQMAAKPQIMKYHASNDCFSMNKLIARVSKYSSYLMGCVGLPLFLEIDYILRLWLGEVPEYTIPFARLALIQGLIQAIDFPIGTGIHAVGKMKLPNITSAIVYMSILPISYCAIKMGASPEVAYILIVSIYPLALIVDAMILNHYTGFQVYSFLNDTIKTLIIIIVSAAIAYVASCIRFNPSVWRVVLTTIISVFTFICILLVLGLNRDERQYFKDIILEKLRFLR